MAKDSFNLEALLKNAVEKEEEVGMALSNTATPVYYESSPTEKFCAIKAN